MMKRLFVASTFVLALAACGGDAGPTGSRQLALPEGPPSATIYPSGSIWSIFATQTPTSTLAGIGEVGTRFYTTQEGAVIGLRFWQAAGESGTHVIKLWTDSGALLSTRTVTTTGSGWKTAYFTGIRGLADSTYYRVSVNINSHYVRSTGAFSGPISNGPLVATSGYYGSPAGSMPTQPTADNVFVDLIFQVN
ncbi:MAG TPA: DUF4082 domain-containing protein [Longimicrobium sp.]